MSATRKPTSGGVDDLRAALKRRRADLEAGPSAERTAGGEAGAPTDAHADARVHGGADRPLGGPESAVDASADPGGSQTTGEGLSEPQRPSQGPRRMLEVKARAYRGGWVKLRPRAEALAEAVRDVLAVGGTAAEVRGLLAEVGVSEDAIPPEVRALLKRR